MLWFRAPEKVYIKRGCMPVALQELKDVMGKKTVQAGVPVPTFSSAIAYFDSYRAENLPANLIQAQRDYFGAHTYERKDKEGIYHYSWYDEK